MTGSLISLALRLSYGPSDDRLHEFYIPALSASVRYERMAGFFTSGALAVAAAGVAHLVAGGGRMRLLVGAQLEPQDVEAICALTSSLLSCTICTHCTKRCDDGTHIQRRRSAGQILATGDRGELRRP